jgi:hypothetical protein
MEAEQCEEKKRRVKGGKSETRGEEINEGRRREKEGVCETRKEKERE